MSVQVKKANTTFETPKPISLELHNNPVSDTISFVALMYKYMTGNEKSAALNISLPFHQSYINCKLMLNQAKILAIK